MSARKSSTSYNQEFWSIDETPLGMISGKKAMIEVIKTGSVFDAA